jgi:hypothetical protein
VGEFNGPITTSHFTLRGRLCFGVRSRTEVDLQGTAREPPAYQEP